jgi:hypothetical protein
VFVYSGESSFLLVVPPLKQHAASSFTNGLKNLVITDGVNHASKVSLICDHLLEWNEDGLSGEGAEFALLHPNLTEYYLYNKAEGMSESWMVGMYLSRPCGVFDKPKCFNCSCCKKAWLLQDA